MDRCSPASLGFFSSPTLTSSSNSTFLPDLPSYLHSLALQSNLSAGRNDLSAKSLRHQPLFARMKSNFCSLLSAAATATYSRHIKPQHCPQLPCLSPGLCSNYAQPGSSVTPSVKSLSTPPGRDTEHSAPSLALPVAVHCLLCMCSTRQSALYWLWVSGPDAYQVLGQWYLNE